MAALSVVFKPPRHAGGLCLFHCVNGMLMAINTRYRATLRLEPSEGGHAMTNISARLRDFAARVSCALLLSLIAIPATAAAYIGTYEISYLYNSMGDPDGLNRPVGSIPIGSVSSAPIEVTLTPGSYYTTFVAGRITGNDFYDYGYPEYRAAYDAYVPLLNPGSVYPEMGFNGGNTDPTHNNPLDGW
jgi:hypothetical protein